MNYAKTVTILLVLSILAVITYAALPITSHSFSGSVTIGGASAPAGSTITASIGGVEKGSITTTSAGLYGAVSATDSKLEVTGCVVGDACYSATQTITFTITGSSCSVTTPYPTATFSSGTVESRTLAFSGSCTSTGAGSTSSSGGGGGGSGGSGAAARAPKTFDVAPKGGQITLRINDKIKFTFEGEDHYFTLDEVTREYIIGTWTSLPQTIQVPLGQTVNIDLTDDGKEDVSTTLLSVSGTLKEATIIIAPILEEEKAEEKTTTAEEPPAETPPGQPKQFPTGMVIIAAIIIVGLIGYYIYYKKTNSEY